MLPHFLVEWGDSILIGSFQFRLYETQFGKQSTRTNGVQDCCHIQSEANNAKDVINAVILLSRTDFNHSGGLFK